MSVVGNGFVSIHIPVVVVPVGFAYIYVLIDWTKGDAGTTLTIVTTDGSPSFGCAEYGATFAKYGTKRQPICKFTKSGETPSSAKLDVRTKVIAMPTGSDGCLCIDVKKPDGTYETLYLRGVTEGNVGEAWQIVTDLVLTASVFATSGEYTLYIVWWSPTYLGTFVARFDNIQLKLVA